MAGGGKLTSASARMSPGSWPEEKRRSTEAPRRAIADAVEVTIAATKRTRVIRRVGYVVGVAAVAAAREVVAGVRDANAGQANRKGRVGDVLDVGGNWG